MDEALNRYLRALADPEIPVGLSDVERLMKDYPFFTLPALTMMQREGNVLPSETRRKLLGQIALNAPDPAAFAALSDPERDTWLNFYPAEKKAPVTTENVIDTFLSTYGHSSPQEDALLERLIFHPTADYSALLAREEREQHEALDALDSIDARSATPPVRSLQDTLIEAFINQVSTPSEQPDQPEESDKSDQSDKSDKSDLPDLPDKSDLPDLPEDSAPTVVTPPADHPVAVVTEPAADTSLSESLAKIYIRRRRYDKAFEIIHSLSLNNPKKSVYFADQLRFLRKLMLNSSLSEQNKPSN